MREMMIDLETLDTTHSAIVLSIGAVVWEDENIIERFMRVLDIDEQVRAGRTLSQHTLTWWLRQDRTAMQEAFNPVRQSMDIVLDDFNEFCQSHKDKGLNRFWAGPATFDFPIWENLCEDFGKPIPWSHRQRYDLRTAVSALHYSVKNHVSSCTGIPHMPVYDCEVQIRLLEAARYNPKEG